MFVSLIASFLIHFFDPFVTVIQTDRHTYRASDEVGYRGAIAPKNMRANFIMILRNCEIMTVGALQMWLSSTTINMCELL